MGKYEDDIHNATPERLAELLEELVESVNIYASKVTLTERQWDAVEFANCVITEAALRLRERRRPAFNNEQFE